MASDSPDRENADASSSDSLSVNNSNSAKKKVSFGQGVKAEGEDVESSTKKSKGLHLTVTQRRQPRAAAQKLKEGFFRDAINVDDDDDADDGNHQFSNDGASKDDSDEEEFVDTHEEDEENDFKLEDVDSEDDFKKPSRKRSVPEKKKSIVAKPKTSSRPAAPKKRKSEISKVSSSDSADNRVALPTVTPTNSDGDNSACATVAETEAELIDAQQDIERVHNAEEEESTGGEVSSKVVEREVKVVHATKAVQVAKSPTKKPKPVQNQSVTIKKSLTATTSSAPGKGLSSMLGAPVRRVGLSKHGGPAVSLHKK